MKLIILVQRHECLYNLQHKDYDNSLVKDNCWKEIVGELLHCRRMAGERHGICELAFNVAGEQHGMCESALTVHFPLLFASVPYLCLYRLPLYIAHNPILCKKIWYLIF
jgi:hypothetical protein